MDISGRPYLAFVADLPPAYLLGNFEVETAEDFFRALCFAAGITLHVREIVGSNAHHVLEAMFKAVARALDSSSDSFNLFMFLSIFLEFTFGSN